MNGYNTIADYDTRQKIDDVFDEQKLWPNVSDTKGHTLIHAYTWEKLIEYCVTLKDAFKKAHDMRAAALAKALLERKKTP